jgi:hypothetical protein
MAENKWKTNLVQKDFQTQKRTKMWNDWRLLWGQIDNWRCEWSVVRYIWTGLPSIKCKHRIGTWETCAPRWFQKQNAKVVSGTLQTLPVP